MPRGSVVLVPFPFDDLSATKVRPAVCLTDPIGPFGHTVLAFVTSTVPADPLETDLVLIQTIPRTRRPGCSRVYRTAASAYDCLR
ncbi:MAG TPA: hypothetical protein VK821_12205, partial [Dehalococcoidia bacterium]|nr:hypothetical protein [Dehalococcoidia bacterium]